MNLPKEYTEKMKKLLGNEYDSYILIDVSRASKETKELIAELKDSNYF